MTTNEITTDEYFGGCPECGETNGYLNVGRSHWFVCDAHRTKWFIGENLFSSWRDESEADWRRSAEKLAGHREVKPIYPEPTEEERRQKAKHEAWSAECKRIDKGFGVVCGGPDGIRAIEPGESLFAGLGE